MKASTTRKRVNRKILWFSLAIGVGATLVAAAVFVASAYPAINRSKESNKRALSEIVCEGATCNIRAFVADTDSSGADYVIDTQARYFIMWPTPTAESPGRFPPLDYLDISFTARFRKPASYATPDGEIWRLYSQAVTFSQSSFEVIVGNQMKAPSKLDVPGPPIETIDASLIRDARQIAANLLNPRTTSRQGRSVLTADGFAVVQANTGRVAKWGSWLPEFLPVNVKLPRPGLQPYVYEGDVYLLQTDANEDVLAASVIQLGGLLWILGTCAIAFLVMTIIAQVFGRRFLRSYFATRATKIPTLEEALRTGEGPSIEFKRGLSPTESKLGNVEEELLKSIAAFANSNDGVIFIGIDDAGHLKGLELDFTSKDRMERKIRQLVRNRIRPTPPVQLAFEDHRGLVVLRIVVARGEDPAYLLGGVIYVRYGSSDVQAQPEDLKRLVSEYAR